MSKILDQGKMLRLYPNHFRIVLVNGEIEVEECRKDLTGGDSWRRTSSTLEMQVLKEYILGTLQS